MPNRFGSTDQRDLRNYFRSFSIRLCDANDANNDANYDDSNSFQVRQSHGCDASLFSSQPSVSARRKQSDADDFTSKRPFKCKASSKGASRQAGGRMNERTSERADK